MKISAHFFAYLSLLLVFSCGNEDEEPVPSPPTFPQVYALGGYTHTAPAYFLVEDPGISEVVPTPEFANHMEVILIQQELPEVSDLFQIREVTLVSETEVSVLTLDPTDNTTTLNEGLSYEVNGNELLVFNPDMTQSIPFNYDEGTGTLEYCEVVFAHTYYDSSSNRTRYTGFDFNACFIYDEQNLPLSYRENTAVLEAQDTLGFVMVERIFEIQ